MRPAGGQRASASTTPHPAHTPMTAQVSGHIRAVRRSTPSAPADLCCGPATDHSHRCDLHCQPREPPADTASAALIEVPPGPLTRPLTPPPGRSHTPLTPPPVARTVRPHPPQPPDTPRRGRPTRLYR